MIKLKINRPIGCGTLISIRKMNAQACYSQVATSLWTSWTSGGSYMTVSNTTNGWQYNLTPALTAALVAGNWREAGNFYPREDL